MNIDLQDSHNSETSYNVVHIIPSFTKEKYNFYYKIYFANIMNHLNNACSIYSEQMKNDSIVIYIISIIISILRIYATLLSVISVTHSYEVRIY